MTTQVLPFGKLAIALGVNWSIKTPAEAKTAAKGASAFIIKKNGNDEALLATVDHIAAKSKKLVPAGLLLGKVYPEAIIFHPLSEDSVWFCAIAKGVPLPDMDVITTPEEAKVKVSQAFRTASADLIGSMSGALVSLEQALEAVQRNIENKIITKKEIESITFRNGGLDFKYVLMGLLVLALAGGAVIAVTQYKAMLAKKRELEAVAQRALKSEKERQQIEERLNRQMAEFTAKVEEGRKALDSGTSVRVNWKACELIRRALPISMYGFRPEKLRCDFTASKATVEWSAGQSLVDMSDRAKLPNVRNAMAYEAPAVSEWDLTPAEHEASVNDVAMETLRFDVGTWAATYLKTMSVAQPKEMKVTPPNELREARKVSPVSLGMKAEWVVQGSGSEFVHTLPHALSLVSKFTSDIKEIEWLKPSSPERSLKASGHLYSVNKQ